MNNLKLLAAIALCMAYVAGIATGWAGYTLAGEHPPAPDNRDSWLSHTLQLDDGQRDQMKAIWSKEAGEGNGEDPRSKMRTLYEERNNQVRAMLTEEQQREFDAIYQAFDEKKEAFSEERRQRHDDAVEKTMAILTQEQQVKYQKILDDFERRGPKRGHGPGPSPGSGPWPREK